MSDLSELFKLYCNMSGWQREEYERLSDGKQDPLDCLDIAKRVFEGKQPDWDKISNEVAEHLRNINYKPKNNMEPDQLWASVVKHVFAENGVYTEKEENRTLESIKSELAEIITDRFELFNASYVEELLTEFEDAIIAKSKEGK